MTDRSIRFFMEIGIEVGLPPCTRPSMVPR